MIRGVVFVTAKVVFILALVVISVLLDDKGSILRYWAIDIIFFAVAVLVFIAPPPRFLREDADD